MGAVADWSIIATHIIDGIFALAAAAIAWGIRKQIKTPSGDPIGQVVERTHDLAAVNTAQLKHQSEALEALNGEEEHHSGVKKKASGKKKRRDV